MRSTTTYERGHVVVVDVTFTDGTGAKRRPALVVSVGSFHARLPDLVLCPISSQPRLHRRPGAGDVPLGKWRSAGLRHPSTVRVSNIIAVDKKLIGRVLGELHREDMQRVVDCLRGAFGISQG